jgi:hypothetical protein
LITLRTVRNGKVRIHGKEYSPSEQHKKYNGRFEGLRLAFGIYPDNPEFVSLWGSAAEFHATEEERDKLWPGITCDEDHAYPWLWWNRIDAEK